MHYTGLHSYTHASISLLVVVYANALEKVVCTMVNLELVLLLIVKQ